MTLPPERIGDKGQRYEVQADGYPRAGINTIGWSDDPDSAEKMRMRILLAPSCTAARVIDRHAQENEQ